MYICSFLLFLSATTVLLMGINNCRRNIVSYKKHNEACHVLKIDERNIDFRDHFGFQNDINEELKLLKQS